MVTQLLHLRSVLFLLLFTFALVFECYAQARDQYTGNNTILISFESPKGLIDFRSDDMQVRFNKETFKIECRVSVNSLFALNDTVPSDLAYNVLFAARHPELVFEIDAPDEILNSPRLNAEPQQQRILFELQGKANETRIPVVFASDKGVINFSTNFDLRMGNFNATVPVRYAQFLSGRMQVTIRNARWLNNNSR